jgi:hypothetical protein
VERTDGVGAGKERRIGAEEVTLADEALTGDVEGLARMDQGDHGHRKGK